MHKIKEPNLKLNNNDNSEFDYYIIPTVSHNEIEPKIKIYDYNEGIWFNQIGFNRKITDK
jgi:hypothetical protein